MILIKRKIRVRRKLRIGTTCIVGLLVFGSMTDPAAGGGLSDAASQAGRPPGIDPDYSNTVIPPNIAPLNFKILEDGTSFQVEISGQSGKPVLIRSRKPTIRIPQKAWSALLEANAGSEIQIRIQAKGPDGWKEFSSFSNHVAREKVDSHLFYRLIEPQFNYWLEMGIYARNLENFDETCILHNRLTENNCMNCHSFWKNGPERMLFHMRAGQGSGTYIFRDDQLYKIDTSTDFNKAGAYPSWHPNGNLIAFSVNKLTQFFHGKGEIRDVMDWASDLICYDLSSNTVSTFPSIASLDRSETFPAWSHDGRYLYFCSAPKLEAFMTEEDNLLYRKIRYDLMRVAYSVENGTWGEAERVVDAEALGKSITMPRPSPDGRFVVFCTADYGNFPIFRNEADLYLLDLRDGRIHRMDVNSDRADTFHSWSSNGRWMVFSSKRRDGLRARPYFSYIREDGTGSKPFLLPQKDPDFYLTFFKTYNRPELATGLPDLRWQEIVRTAYDPDSVIKAGLDPKVKVDRTTGATPMSENMWRPAPKE